MRCEAIVPLVVSRSSFRSEPVLLSWTATPDAVSWSLENTAVVASSTLPVMALVEAFMWPKSRVAASSMRPTIWVDTSPSTALKRPAVSSSLTVTSEA